MDRLTLTGLAVLAYLLLLARSARRQGELRQFGVSLLILAGICGFIAAAIAIAVYFGAG